MQSLRQKKRKTLMISAVVWLILLIVTAVLFPDGEGEELSAKERQEVVSRWYAH